MARLGYAEDGKWHYVDGIEKVDDGRLIRSDPDSPEVAHEDLDPDEVIPAVEEMLAAEEEDEEGEEEDEEEEDEEVSPKMWKLKATPVQYLKQSPDGPQSELANALVKAGHGDVSSG